jgi:hypothetical protein
METIKDYEHHYILCDDIGQRTGTELVDTRPKKRARTNPVAEDVFLLPDGSIQKDEDRIVACQRIWIHNAYRPDGRMFRKNLASVSLRWGQTASHTKPSGPSFS